jgi:hypothetical protein
MGVVEEKLADDDTKMIQKKPLAKQEVFLFSEVCFLIFQILFQYRINGCEKLRLLKMKDDFEGNRQKHIKTFKIN